MGLNQGFIRITKGHLKVLSAIERNRGFIFITKDKRAKELIGERVTIRFQGAVAEFKFDKFGRALTGKSFLKKLPDEFKLKYKDGVVDITL